MLQTNKAVKTHGNKNRGLNPEIVPLPQKGGYFADYPLPHLFLTYTVPESPFLPRTIFREVQWASAEVAVNMSSHFSRSELCQQNKNVGF